MQMTRGNSKCQKLSLSSEYTATWMSLFNIFTINFKKEKRKKIQVVHPAYSPFFLKLMVFLKLCS